MNNLQRMLNDIEMEVELTRNFIGKDSLDKRVMAAIKQVPRHQFIPEELHYCAYNNSPVPIQDKPFPNPLTRVTAFKFLSNRSLSEQPSKPGR